MPAELAAPGRVLVPLLDQRTVIVSTEEAGALLDRVRQVGAGWLGVAAENLTVTPLQLSTKAAVVRLEGPGGATLVGKVHATSVAYGRECLAYALLGGLDRGGPVPTLLAAERARRVLLLEDVPVQVSAADPRGLAEAADLLGQVHRRLDDAQLVLRRLCPDRTLGASRHGPPPGGIAAAAPYAELLGWYRVWAGDDHVPACVGDLKVGHVRRRRSGGAALVDLETFAPGVIDLIDLALLRNLASTGDEVAWRRQVVEPYLAARFDGSPPSSTSTWDRALACAIACLARTEDHHAD